MKLPVIHTSDLTEPCPRRVLLRHKGKTDGLAPGALVWGCIADEALRILHARYRPEEWPTLTSDIFGLHSSTVIVKEAAALTLQRLADEGRTVTDAAARDARPGMPMFADVVRMVDGYIHHFARYFALCELIGTQVPINLRYGGREFASHVDLVFWGPSFDGERRLQVWDWKWRQDSPHGAYLVRNAQMILYWLAGRYGQFLVAPPRLPGFDPVFDSPLATWQRFDVWPELSWVHLPACLPYGRGGTHTNTRSGEVRTWKKGDPRPVEMVRRPVWFNADAPDAEAAAWLIVEERIKMMEAGLYPLAPDPVGCGLCGSRQWCGGVAAVVDDNEEGADE